MNRPAKSHTALLISILILAATYQLTLLNRPFRRDPEGCGAFYGLLARNYFRYDFSTTAGLPVMSMGRGAPPVFYANHSPATPGMIAIVYALCGYRGGYDMLPSEWQARLPTLCFTLGCITLIYLLLARRGSPRGGLLAAAIFASVPMTLIYGGLPDCINTQIVFFALLTVAAYEPFADDPSPGKLLLLCGAFAGAAVMDWPAFFLVPILTLHYVLTHPPRKWGWMVIFGFVSVFLFAAMYGYLSLRQPSWDWMRHQVERRGGAAVADSEQRFTTAEWFHHAIWQLGVGRHTLLIVIGAIAWVICASLKRFARKTDRFAGLIVAWGIMHVLLGRQGVYQHEWWWWPVTPGLAIASGLMIDHLFSALENRPSLPPNICNFAAVLFIAIFAARNGYTAVSEIQRGDKLVPGRVEYTLVEFGRAIRENVPPDHVVLISESDDSLAFWYYADRALKREIWDFDTLIRRLNEPIISLSFNHWATWNAPADSIIIPKSFQPLLVPPMLQRLQAIGPARDLGKFVLFDIRSLATTQPATAPGVP